MTSIELLPPFLVAVIWFSLLCIVMLWVLQLINLIINSDWIYKFCEKALSPLYMVFGAVSLISCLIIMLKITFKAFFT